jgi:precorrin-3B synthase
MLVDGDGTVSIAGERADIALCAVGERMALGIDTRSGTRWLGSVDPGEAVSAAVALAQAFLKSGVRGRMRDLVSVEVPVPLQPLERAPAGSRRAVGLLPGAVGIAAPFGQLEAEQLHDFVGLAEEAGATSLRLSPWRTLYIGASDPQPVLEGARALGLIVRTDDPLLRVDACPGMPSCRSSSVETRRHARRLAERGLQGTLHVSGCAKGCARSAPADLVLVGEEGRFGVVHDGTTRDRPEQWLRPDEL